MDQPISKKNLHEIFYKIDCLKNSQLHFLIVKILILWTEVDFRNSIKLRVNLFL